jgi:DNA polymerase-1
VSRLLLVDGDILCFKFAAACEHNIDWGGGVHTLSADLDEAKANLDAHLAGLMSDLDADEMLICRSDPKRNFRKQRIDETYKANRKDLKKPLILREVEQHMEEKYKPKRSPTLEGDDVIGILATHPKLYSKFDEKVIVSEDKDMKTIPGLLYQGGDLFDNTPEEADFFHMLQTLTGDRVDGYPGCPSVGPVKAAAVLTGHHASVINMWSAVVEAYERRKLAEADALRQARLARILRHTDYDFKKKEPILWQPPQPT